MKAQGHYLRHALFQLYEQTTKFFPVKVVSPGFSYNGLDQWCIDIFDSRTQQGLATSMGDTNNGYSMIVNCI